MSYYDKILADIKKARDSEPLWIPVRYPSLSKQVGISRRLYHLFGGDPGTGKTAFVDQTYVLDAHGWTHQSDRDVKIKTVYFSMERSKKYKEAKWIAHRLWTQHGVLIDTPTIRSWGMGEPLTDRMLELAEQEKPFFDRLYDNLIIYDGIRNPTGIYKTMVATALSEGTIYGRDPNGSFYKITLESWKKGEGNSKIPISPSHCPIADELKPRNREYVQDDDRLILQIILDHVGKPRPERGFTDKQTIDKTSEYMQVARDVYGYNVVVISQFNRNNADTQRRIHTTLTPEQQDFKGSGNTYEDCDVAFGLFNPYKHNITSYMKYNIPRTVKNGFSRFRSVSLLKNSYGVDNLIAGFLFLGECGYFEQIPPPEKVNYESIFDV